MEKYSKQKLVQMVVQKWKGITRITENLGRIPIRMIIKLNGLIPLDIRIPSHLLIILMVHLSLSNMELCAI